MSGNSRDSVAFAVGAATSDTSQDGIRRFIAGDVMRDSAADARLVHAQEEAGSTPAPATNPAPFGAVKGDSEAKVSLPQANPDGLGVFASGQAPAGVVRLPGEELLEAIESEEDIVRANKELLEGTELTELQLEKWRRLYKQVMDEANKRLRGRGAMLLVAMPNPNGLGAVFTGVDLERFEAAKRSNVLPVGGEDYEVVLTLPARQRVDLQATEREEFVRKVIGWVCDGVLEQKAQYEAKAGMN